jgi:hypothetical protein
MGGERIKKGGDSMSNAHRGSRLVLSGNSLPVDFTSAHFDYNNDETGIQFGDLVEADASSVFTMRPYQGKFGGAIAIEQSTTNLYSSQSSFTGSSVQSATYDATANEWTLTITGGSTASWRGMKYTKTDAIIPSGGGYATISFEAYSNEIVPIYADVNNYGLLSGSSNDNDIIAERMLNTGSTIIGEWKPCTINIHFSANTQGFYDQTVIGFGNSWTPTHDTQMKIRNVQFELRSYATSFANTTRANGLLKYPKQVIGTDEGCISFWYYASASGNNFAGVPQPIFSSGVDGGFDLLIDSSGTDYLRAYSTSSISTQMHPTLICDAWTHVVVYWKRNTDLGVYINGALNVSVNNPVDWGAYYDANATGFYIGSGIRSNPNILVSDLKIDRKMPTAEDVSSWYLSNRPFHNPFDRRAYAL